jgi:hypothetical protein
MKTMAEAATPHTDRSSGLRSVRKGRTMTTGKAIDFLRISRNRGDDEKRWRFAPCGASTRTIRSGGQCVGDLEE